MANICIIGKIPPIQGGTAISTITTAQQLTKNGHKVTIISNPNECDKTSLNVFLQEDIDYLTSNLDIQFRYTTPPINTYHIPYSPTYLSRITGKALSVLSEESFDLVLGWYIEPYGIAALLAGSILNIPVAIRHAGSDLARLSIHPDLKQTYSYLLKKANFIITSEWEKNLIYLDKLNVERNILRFTKGTAVSEYFRTPINTIDIQKYQILGIDYINHINTPNADAYFSPKPHKVVLGIYGKIGNLKGTFSLLDAISMLDQDIILRYAFSGDSSSVKRFLDIISKDIRLKDKIELYPSLPPWRMPEFINSCDGMLFLEHNFPVKIHTPKIVREVIHCGKPLICSRDIAEKQSWNKNITHGKNMIIIDDPSCPKQIRLGILNHMHNFPDIGFRAKKLSDFLDLTLDESQDTAHIVNNILIEINK